MLKIFTEDVNKIGSYTLRLTVSFHSDTVVYDNTAQLSFYVNIKSGTGAFKVDELLPSGYEVSQQGLLSM